MKNWLKTLLFVSAFSPVLLILAGVRFSSTGIDTMTRNHWFKFSQT
jgi:hypothetical protein